MDAAFQKAAEALAHSHRGVRVYGFALQDLTVGHLFLLSEINSPFISGTAIPTFFDLLVAVLVCARPAGESRRNLQAWWFSFFLRIWARFVCRQNFLREYGKFLAYWSASHESPRGAGGGAAGARTLNSPGHWRLLVILMREMRMSQQEAMNTPVRLANCFEATVGDLDGTIELQSQRIRDLIAFAEAEDRKLQPRMDTNGHESRREG